jgi:hypothetical protein
MSTGSSSNGALERERRPNGIPELRVLLGDRYCLKVDVCFLLMKDVLQSGKWRSQVTFSNDTTSRDRKVEADRVPLSIQAALKYVKLRDALEQLISTGRCERVGGIGEQTGYVSSSSLLLLVAYVLAYYQSGGPYDRMSKAQKQEQKRLPKTLASQAPPSSAKPAPVLVLGSKVPLSKRQLAARRKALQRLYLMGESPRLAQCFITGTLEREKSEEEEKGEKQARCSCLQSRKTRATAGATAGAGIATGSAARPCVRPGSDTNPRGTAGSSRSSRQQHSRPVPQSGESQGG